MCPQDLALMYHCYVIMDNRFLKNAFIKGAWSGYCAQSNSTVHSQNWSESLLYNKKQINSFQIKSLSRTIK